MRVVRFPLKTRPGTALIEYPDDQAAFGRSVVVGDWVYAEYAGAQPLETSFWPAQTSIGADVRALCEQVDAAADATRLAHIGDPARAFEYLESERQAQAFAAANYGGEPGAFIRIWADAKGWTSQVACDDILRAAGVLRAALERIRMLRLGAKERIRSLPLDEAQAVAEQAIADLVAMRPIAPIR